MWIQGGVAAIRQPQKVGWVPGRGKAEEERLRPERVVPVISRMIRALGHAISALFSTPDLCPHARCATSPDVTHDLACACGAAHLANCLLKQELGKGYCIEQESDGKVLYRRGVAVIEKLCFGWSLFG